MKKFSIICLSILLVNFLTGCTLNIQMGKEKDEQKEVSSLPKLDQESSRVIEEKAMEKGMDTNVSTESSLIVPSAVRLNNDDEVVEYFNTVNDQIDYLANQSKSETVKEKLANTFITIVDFLFYDGTIGGVTFSDLTDSAKEKVLSIAHVIDQKIEQYFPGYKEKIKDTTSKIYSGASEKIKETIAKGKDYVKEHMDEDTYEQLVEDGSNFVDSFKHAGEVVKDVLGAAKDKVKDWYEGFRDKHKNDE